MLKAEMADSKIKTISFARFNALGGYARAPEAWLTFEELEYFETSSGNVIGIATKDHTDQDFGGLVLAKDQMLRFRCVNVEVSYITPEKAKEKLFADMGAADLVQDEEHYQGDDAGNPIDFFTNLHEPEKLNPSFVQLTTNEVFSPAREIINPMMRWYEDLDGNFVEQFQTTGFDQRIWELYLFSTLIEAEYNLSQENNVPDFCCSGLLGDFSIEAVTVGPTMKNGLVVPPPVVDTKEAKERYLQDYMPIKFGSPLFSKLKKKYWELEHVAGAPFVLAIADFSAPMSMVTSKSALERYLYGFEYVSQFDENGNLMILPKRIEQHQWEGKIIPSGFFGQPDAENISAVVSSNAGTLAKFNRMGILCKFGSKKVLAVRNGTMVDHNPNTIHPKFFRVIVNAAGYEETWIEGLNVYHNPNAKIPLPMEMLTGAAHHFIDENGQMTSFTPDFHPFASTTEHQFPVDVESILAEAGDKTHVVWTPKPNNI